MLSQAPYKDTYTDVGPVDRELPIMYARTYGGRVGFCNTKKRGRSPSRSEVAFDNAPVCTEHDNEVWVFGPLAYTAQEVTL